MDGDRSAALLLRVWTEDGSDTFRCRLVAVDTSPGRDAGRETTLAVTSSSGEVLATVREWLDGFRCGAAKPIDTD